MEHEQESEAAGAAAGESAPSAEATEAAAFVAAGGARRAATRAPAIDARATAKPASGAGKVQPKKPACSKPPARVRKRTKRAATGGATAGELCDDPLDDRGRGEEGEEEEVDEPLPDDRGARKMCWAIDACRQLGRSRR